MNKTPNIATDNKDGRIAPENVPETNVGKINGRTPDEIKKGLNCNNIDNCNECPYDGLDCAKHVDQNALAYIQQLESRLAQVERERDALDVLCERVLHHMRFSRRLCKARFE